MSFGLSDVQAKLTIDASGFVSGAQQAAASLDALDASGNRATQSSMQLQTGLGGAAAALDVAMGKGSGFAQALDRAAAAAGTAAAKVDALSLKTEAARQAMDSAARAAAESTASLETMREALEIDNSNITELEAELEALRQSGDGAQDGIQALEATLEELRADTAALETEIEKGAQTVEKNGNAAAQAAAKYNQYAAQLNQAQVAADAANAKVEELNQNMQQSAGSDTGIGALAGSLSSWGTSTLTSASRSLSSMAVSMTGLASGTAESTLAARGLSTALRMATQAAGPWGIAIAGAAALSVTGFKAMTNAWNDTHDISSAMQNLLDNASGESYSAALKNVNLELEESGIQSQISEKLQHCFDTLTDGKADTPEVVSELHTDIDTEYSGIRAQVDQYFKEAIEGAETEEAKQALIEKEQEILDSIQATQDAANALVDSYAGKSTEVCKDAEGEINEIQQRVNALIESLNTAKALLDNQYGDSYAKVSSGYYATEQDIEWSLTYIQADRTNAEAQAKEAYETAMAALNDAFRGKDGSEALEVEYSYGGVDYKISGTFDELTHQIEGEYQDSLDVAQNEMLARWNRMLSGLAESNSMGGEATQAFAALGDAVDAHAVISGIAERITDGSFTAAELGNLGTDFWEKLGSAIDLDSAQAQKGFETALQISPAAALAMLATWDNSLNAAITDGTDALSGSGFGELFAAAMESGLFEGIDNLDMESTLAQMQALAGRLPVDEGLSIPVSPEVELAEDPFDMPIAVDEPLPIQAELEIAEDPFDMPVAVDEPIQVQAEMEYVFPSAEELDALYGDVTIPGYTIEPEITLPSPEELAALNGVESEFATAGDNAGSAFVSALRGHLSTAANAGAAIAAAALAAMKAKLNIHSPSRETYKLGLYTGEGFSLGIRERAQMAQQSMQGMASAALSGAKSAQSVNNSRSVTINLNGATIRSDEDVRKLSRALGRYMNDANYGMS